MGDRDAGSVPGHAGVPAGDAHRGYGRHGDRCGGHDRLYQTTKVILVEQRLGSLGLGVDGSVHSGLIHGGNLVVGKGVLVLIGLGPRRGVGCRHVWLVGSRRRLPGRTRLLSGLLGLWLLGKFGFLGSRLILRLLTWRCRA